LLLHNVGFMQLEYSGWNTWSVLLIGMLTFAACNSIAMLQILMSCSMETRTCSAQALHAQWFH